MIGDSGLRAVLKRNRLRQKDVAVALGVSQPTVLRWCDGTIPSGDNLRRLVEYLRGFEPEVSVDEVLGTMPEQPTTGGEK